MTTENKQVYQGFRMLSVVVPLNSHQQTQGRQRNVKIHYLMRLLAYRIRVGRNYYRLKSQNETPLHHGALCLRFKRQFKLEALLEQTWLSDFVEKLHAEALCPCLYIYDDGGEGESSHLCTIPVAPHADLQKAPTVCVDYLEDGICMDPGHVPHFACQMLILPARKPLEEIKVSDESYRSWFS